MTSLTIPEATIVSCPNNGSELYVTVYARVLQGGRMDSSAALASLRRALAALVVTTMLLSNGKTPVGATESPQAGSQQRINLAERLAAHKLRAVNREVTT